MISLFAQNATLLSALATELLRDLVEAVVMRSRGDAHKSSLAGYTNPSC